MKLQPLTIVLFLISPTTAANCSRRHCRTLSTTQKKPASLAGFLFLTLYIIRLIAHLPPAAQLHPPIISSSSLLKLQLTSSPA